MGWMLRVRRMGERPPARGGVSQPRTVLSALPRDRETQTTTNSVLSDRYQHTAHMVQRGSV